MAVRTAEIEAIVLRTLKYGDTDLIAHLFTREHGRRNVIAKGARRPKSRLGARLDPFLTVRLQAREGRGDLAIVQSVEVLSAHDGVRSSWENQEAGAVALDMLGRLTVEHASNEPAFHLASRFLALLDTEVREDAAREALLAGFEFKLLHLAGIAPHLGSCARCGSAGPLVGWSPADGGAVCDSCQVAADASLEPAAYRAALQATATPLAQLVAASAGGAGEDEAAFRAARHRIVEPMCVEHAGFRPKRR